MKCRKMFILLLFTFLFMISNVCAKDVTQSDTKAMFKDKFHSDPAKYCYYSDNGVDDGTYAAIVAISKDGTNAIVNYKGDSKVIKNWNKNSSDSDSDDDLNFWAYDNYYKLKGNCPQILYNHIVFSTSNNIYLINLESYKSVLSTFTNTINEEYYILNDGDTDTNVSMTCKYTYDYYLNKSATIEEEFEIKYNKNGKILNADSQEWNITFSSELMASSSSVKVCPQISACINNDLQYYKIYYGDYVSDGKDGESCKQYFCTNTSDSYCDPNNTESYICNTYKNYVDLIENDIESYNEAENSSRKRSAVNSYKENREYMVNWCNSVLSSQNSDDPCLSNCLKYNDVLTEYDSKILNKSSSTECGISNRLAAFINQILKIVKYALPVFVIIFGILDFIKAIASDKEDTMKKAQSRFIRRLIAAALVFIVPFILEFIIEKAGFIVEDCGLNWF